MIISVYNITSVSRWLHAVVFPYSAITPDSISESIFCRGFFGSPSSCTDCISSVTGYSKETFNTLCLTPNSKVLSYSFENTSMKIDV